MPRKRRVVLPGYPHHILHRGHNRQAVFKEEEDYSKYLADVKELKRTFGLDVYAWCLLPNEVHLLVNPGDDAAAMGEFMKSLAARMTRFRNAREARRGTLWESRYRSSPVQESWMLPCVRFLETLPVQEQWVPNADGYRWTSLAERLGPGGVGVLDTVPGWQTLGLDEVRRRQAYTTYLNAAAPEWEQELIRNAVERNQLTGDADFADEVEAITGNRISNRGRGRPPKKDP